MKKPLINSIIFLKQGNQSYAIQERLESGDYFTIVPETDPKYISSNTVCLVVVEQIFNDIPLCYICNVKKQSRVATNAVRLKGTNFLQTDTIDFDSVLEAMPIRFRQYNTKFFAQQYFELSPKLAEAFTKSLVKQYPPIKEIVTEVFLRLPKTVNGKVTPRMQDAALEKDALGLSLDIFGVDRSDIIRRWKRQEGGKMGSSFLNGLEDYTLYEDDIISQDLHNIPGFELITETITGVVEFKNNAGEKLVVINANRKPLEKATGVDLIYFHREYEAFTCVQYKMMDKLDSSNNYYYNPVQRAHSKELERMNDLQDLLQAQQLTASLENYRISGCALFFKLCKKVQMKENDPGLVTGAYFSLDQWKLLINDTSTKGKNGGVQIGYHTIKNRYLRKQTFIDLVKTGLIGTSGNATTRLASFIEAAVEKGHSVIYAIEEKKLDRSFFEEE